MNNLIFDRTETDVTYAKEHQSEATDLKGAYNYSDLNRIEEWCEYLKTELEAAGYTIGITTKTDWTDSDFPTQAQLERIRSNVETIKTGYHSFSNVPTNVKKMTYIKANDIEKVLDEVNTLMESMRDYYIYAGVSHAGQERLWQNRFRRWSRYTPKLYLESTGTQYIDTGIVPKSTTCTELKASFTQIYTNQAPSFCGVYLDNSPNRYQPLLQSYDNNGVPFLGYATTSSSWKRYLVPADTNVHIIKYNDENHNVIFDGETMQDGSPTWSDNNTRSMYIFARRESSGSASSPKAEGRLYYLKMIDTSTNTLLRHFIPVLDKNHVACLFDLVSQEFFYNQGTGEFNCG